MHKRGIINKILLKKNLGRISLFLIVIASFYYPIGATLIIAAGVPSTPVNIAIKLFIAILSLLLIFIGLLAKRKRFSLTKPLWILLLFWIFYSARIIYDLNRGIRFSSYGNEMVYGFAFGSILLPILGILLWRNEITVTNLPKLMLVFFTITCVMIFGTMLKKAGGFSFEMFMIRPHLKSGAAEQKAHVLNPIQISYYGELLALTALYMILIAKKVKSSFYVPFFIFGMMLLFLGASRGPFVSFFITSIIMIAYRYRISKSKIIMTLKYVTIIAGTIIFLGQFFSSTDFMILNRMASFAESRETDKKEYRDYQFASAWNDFLDSPVYGKQFVGTYDLFYPHNIVLEVLMATGLIGGILFGSFFFSVLFKIWRSFQIKDDKIFFIAILALPIMFGGMFSGCLFQSVDLWLMMVLLACIPMQRKKFRRVKESQNYALQ